MLVRTETFRKAVEEEEEPSAITVDAVAFNTSTDASLSLGASADYVLVMVGWETNTTITGVTVGGEAMTDTTLIAGPGDATQTRVQAFYLLSADLPAAGTVAVAVSGPTAYYVQAWSLIGAAQQAPSRSDEDANFNLTSIELALADVPAGAFVASGSTWNATDIPTLAGEETERGSGNGASGGLASLFGDNTVDATATVTHTYTVPSSRRGAALMVELEAA